MNSIERQKPSREDMMTWIKGFTKWPHRLKKDVNPQSM